LSHEAHLHIKVGDVHIYGEFRWNSPSLARLPITERAAERVLTS
jgi:hypothetical protein